MRCKGQPRPVDLVSGIASSICIAEMGTHNLLLRLSVRLFSVFKLTGRLIIICLANFWRIFAVKLICKFEAVAGSLEGITFV